MTEYTYLDSMPQHRFVERHLVTLAIEELAKDGWQLVAFEDEEHVCTPVTNAAEAWEAFDSVDMGWLHFETNSETTWVLLVGGNERDVISDHPMRIDETMRRVFLR